MKYTPSTFNKLIAPAQKTKRTKIDNIKGLYLEQTQSAFSFQMAYTSPITGKRRYISLSKFNYGTKIKKSDLDAVLQQLTLRQADILKDIDPLEQKKALKKAAAAKKNRRTLDQVFHEWEISPEFDALADATQLMYQSGFRNHLQPLYKIDVDQINADHVLDCISPLKGSRYNLALKTLNAILKYGRSKRYLTQLPTTGIEARPQHKGRDIVLNATEIAKVLQSDEGWPSVRNIAKFQSLTACRVSEIIGLQWSEIDFTEKKIIIPAERLKNQRKAKGENQALVLPLLPKLSEILMEQRTLFGADGLVFPRQNRKAGSSRKNIVPIESINLYLKRLLNREDVSSHTLRHTAASTLSMVSGITEYDLKILLNHRVSGVTALYIHGSQLQRRKEILAQLHKALTGHSVGGTENATA